MKRLAAVAVAFATAIPVFLPSPAIAALTVHTAIIDFRPGDDLVTIKARLDGITEPTDPNEMLVKVVVTNRRTGEVQTWEGLPTAIK